MHENLTGLTRREEFGFHGLVRGMCERTAEKGFHRASDCAGREASHLLGVRMHAINATISDCDDLSLQFFGLVAEFNAFDRSVDHLAGILCQREHSRCRELEEGDDALVVAKRILVIADVPEGGDGKTMLLVDKVRRPVPSAEYYVVARAVNHMRVALRHHEGAHKATLCCGIAQVGAL